MNAIEHVWTPHDIDAASRLEAWESDRWAAEALFDVEIFTPRIVDPCCGRGILGEAAGMAGYDRREMVESDVYDWGRGIVGRDFLVEPYCADLHGHSVVMNPPFSKACQFVETAILRGARKVACFQQWNWWAESRKRRAFWDKYPPARIWACGDRATCWLITLSQHDRKFRADGEKRGSSKTAHAWFIWEAGAPPGTSIGKIWDKRKDRAAT